MSDARYQSVVCGVDFSDDARAALMYASRVARRAKGQLSVVYVNDPLLAQAAAISFDARTIAEATERDLQEFLLQTLGPEQTASVRTIVVSGDPADEIKKAAKQLHADLIGVGTRGLGGAGKLFFGSTTSRILRATELPVLAVSAAASKTLKASLDQWPASVMAAIKLDDYAASDAKAAAAVANWFDAPLTLVTVAPPLQLPASLMRRGATDDRARLAAAKAQLNEIAQQVGTPAVETRALVGDAAEQISLTAIDLGADLIVLVLRSETGMLGARQGTVTYRVLSTAQLPVLALMVGANS